MTDEPGRDASDQAKHEMYQRVGVDDDQPAQNPETESGDLGEDPRATDHPAGAEQVRDNKADEPPG